MSGVFVVNCGSSTIKTALVESESATRIIEIFADRLGKSDATLRIRFQGKTDQFSIPNANAELVFSHIFETLSARELKEDIIAVGHRVVQGAEDFRGPTLIDDEALGKIDALRSLAPLHNPAHVVGIQEVRKYLPGTPQVAVFDTSFHQSLPERAYLYALPYEYYEEHRLRRYGAHGTSHRYLSLKAAEFLDRPIEELKLITVHLGNGCSVAAVSSGRSLDTSMGLTPLDGLVMGTRCGEIDPSIHQYLMKKLNLNIDELTEVMNRQSGLLGLSEGLGSDMRHLRDAALRGDPRGQRAREVFAYKAAKTIASYIVPLGYIDAVIFSGGIGENDFSIREDILNHLVGLGLKVDKTANESYRRSPQGTRISESETPMALVIPTDEEWMIAKDTEDLLKPLP